MKLVYSTYSNNDTCIIYLHIYFILSHPISKQLLFYTYKNYKYLYPVKMKYLCKFFPTSPKSTFF